MDRDGAFYVSELRLSHFRSFGPEVALQLRPGLNVIVGANGTGKSNSLDALLFALCQDTSALRCRSWAEVSNRARAGPCAALHASATGCRGVNASARTGACTESCRSAAPQTVVTAPQAESARATVAVYVWVALRAERRAERPARCERFESWPEV